MGAAGADELVTASMSSLDFYDAADKTYRLTVAGRSGAVALRRYFKFCERHFPGPMWARLAKQDLDGELARLMDWLRNVLVNEPPQRVTAF